jgi:hypothetical protein
MAGFQNYPTPRIINNMGHWANNRIKPNKHGAAVALSYLLLSVIMGRYLFSKVVIYSLYSKSTLVWAVTLPSTIRIHPNPHPSAENDQFQSTIR